MSKPADPKTVDSDEQQGPVSQIVKLAAYPISVGLGLWAARVNISDACYNTIRDFDGFGDFLQQRRIGLGDKFRAARRNIEAGISNEGFPNIVRADRLDYFPIVEQRKLDLGIKNVFDEIKFIHRSHKQTAIINGLTIGAVSLGALLAVANSRAVNNLFAKSDKPPSEMSR